MFAAAAVRRVLGARALGAKPAGNSGRLGETLARAVIDGQALGLGPEDAQHHAALPGCAWRR